MRNQSDTFQQPREAQAWLRENFDASMTLRQWWELLVKVGLSQPHWPRAFGGRDWGLAEITELSGYFTEVQAVGAPTGLGVLMGGPVVLSFGSDEQKYRFLPPLANGTDGWCQLFSEPGAGSDLASLSTRAERDGDEWIISGQKVWTSGATDSARGMLVARTDMDAPKHRGLTYFIIEMRQPGIEIRPIKQMNGRSHFSEVFFTEARVSDANRIGAVNDGWAVTTATLGFERSGLSAPQGDPGLRPSAGELAGNLDMTIGELRSTSAGQRVELPDETGGRFSMLFTVAASLGVDNDLINRQHLGGVEATERMAAYSSHRLAAAQALGTQPGPGASLAKLAWTEGLGRARAAGTAILGAYGMLAGTDSEAYIGEGTIQHFALTIPSARIAGGSDEVQRNIIGERVLGLPRDPHSDSSIPFRDLLRS